MKKIAILISTYNGEKFLKDQLNSLFAQSYNNFEIIARDDGSDDDTLKILKEYDIKIIDSGLNLGVLKSFNKLLFYALKHSDAEYFMFCDQDDIWLRDKVEKSIAKMEELEKDNLDSALLVHTDLTVVDKKLGVISKSFYKNEKLNYKINSFKRILLQNIAVGCTQLFNKKLAKLSVGFPNDAIMHDWWIALVASYFGKISFIEDQTVLYRQHSSNTIGVGSFSFKNIVKKVFSNRKILADNVSQAKSFLKKYRALLDPSSLLLLEMFLNIDAMGVFEKRKFLYKNKILKQGVLRNLWMFLKI